MNRVATAPPVIYVPANPTTPPNKLWRGLKVVAISLATAVGPTLVILIAALVAHFLFAPLMYPLIGYAVGWFITSVAMKIEMHYDLRCFVKLRTAVLWLEKKCPLFHLITFIVMTTIGCVSSWGGLFLTIVPASLLAVSCENHYFAALQSQDRDKSEV